MKQLDVDDESSTITCAPVKSALEQRREEKIKRNEQRLKELGLLDINKTIQSQRKKKTIKKRKRSNDAPVRRSTRQRKTVKTYGQEENDVSDDESIHVEDKDDDISVESNSFSDTSNESDNEDHLHAQLRTNSNNSRKVKKMKKGTETKIAKNSSASNASTREYGGITVEYAKTNRSTCRKCRNKIEKGSLRVGMLAWIVGRQAVTWQLPHCFLQRLILKYEPSGRSKCKATNENFDQGEVRFGTRSHTATNYYKAEAIQQIIQNLFCFPLLATSSSEKEIFDLLSAEKIEGYEDLELKDQEYVDSVIANLVQDIITSRQENKKRENRTQPETVESSNTVSSETIDEKSENNEKEENTSSFETKKNKKKVKVEMEQPEIGTKTKTKGKVQWKFGGYTCYGTLLPQKETLTHCYARTHKGNTKTLAKGKSYWSIIA